MTRINEIATIFQMFLYFLSEKAVNILIKNCMEVEDGEKTVRFFNTLLNADADNLIGLIERNGDEEDKVTYLNMFLWKQKIGKIDKDLRIKYDFTEQSYAWLIHRFMIENGYEGIDKIPITIKPENIVTTYSKEIEKYLGFYKERNSYQDDDYFSYLAGNLNVIGPKIKKYQRLSEVREFADYIVSHFNDDDRLIWLSPSAFTMLVYDLQYPDKKSWPVYKKLINNDLDIYDYIALLLGIRMYGDQAKKELKKINILGGYDLLEALAKN